MSRNPHTNASQPSQTAAAIAVAGWRIVRPRAFLGLLLLASGPHGYAVGPTGEEPIYIREYRVQGAKVLPRMEVEEAVYPFLGPERTPADVEQARAALEKAYHDKGFQAVTVQIPQQQVRRGVVMLEVTETTVGRLRVKGSRYHSLERIKAQARSLAEGKVVNFNDVTRDIVALNQWPDRKITPELRPGVTPGTVDIDLNVQDKLPLHGSIELNNRYSPDTPELRLNGSLSYNNLWQRGHSLGASFQISPERIEDVAVYSGYYIARFAEIDWLSLMLQGTKQASNVNTLGSVAVAGRGEVIGLRAIITLPPLTNFFHSFNFGVDYKHFDQQVNLATSETTETPITYWPISAAYGATWAQKGSLTELNAGVTMHLRGTGSDAEEFEANRYKTDGGFIYLRGDLSHTHDLPRGFEGFAKVQGQVSDRPLLNSEQLTGGGLGTVRGYLEAEAVGDSGAFGSLELRSPSLLGWTKKEGNEWRVYAFLEGGVLALQEPLPEQESRFELASYGFGTRLQIVEHLNASVDLGIPLIDSGRIDADDFLLTFRVWADF